MLRGAVLAGEQGLLGVDGMRGRRLRIDFERGCIEIIPSADAPRLRRGWTSVNGQLRFGHLVLVPGRVNGIAVSLFLDTGSNQTLANPALQAAWMRVKAGPVRRKSGQSLIQRGVPWCLMMRCCCRACGLGLRLKLRCAM